MTRVVLCGCWRDSEENMRRALSSCAQRIMGVAITTDPQFPDDRACVERLCVEFGLPCVVWECARVDGGQIRTEMMRGTEAFAHSLAAPYVVNLDSDDWLEFDEGFEWPREGACFDISETCNGLRYSFPRVFRVGLGWSWWGPRHEVPTCDALPWNATHEPPILPVVRYVKGVNRPRSKDAYREDARLLVEWVAAHPEDRRSFYYIGQSWHACGEVAKALEIYEQCIVDARLTAKWPTLRYRAMVHAASIVGEHGAEPLRLFEAFARVAVSYPERAEGWRGLATVCGNIADSLPKPGSADMVNDDAYKKKEAARPVPLSSSDV